MYKSIVSLCSLGLLLASRYLLAQTPVAGFSVPNSACLNEGIVINNTSTDATGFIWDFCNEDFKSTPSGSVSAVLPNTGTFFYHSVKIVYENGEWIGFCTDANTNQLYRLEFGGSLNNTPQIFNLGSLTGFNSSASIELINAGGTWYAFILNLFANGIVRVRFDNGLKFPPTSSEDLGNVAGQLSNPSGIKMLNVNGKYYAYITNLSSNNVCIINFDTSPQNTPVATKVTSQILDSPYGISLITQGNSLFGLVGSFSSSKTFKLNFGTDPFSDPVVTEIDGIPEGADLEFALEGFEYYGLVRSISDGIYIIDFGTDLSGSLANVNRIGTLNLLYNQSRSLSLVRDTPGWKAFTVDATTGNLNQINFLGNCSTEVSLDNSTAQTPTNISYKQPGKYMMELTVSDPLGSRSVDSQTINISGNTAPDIDFSFQNVCANHSTNYQAANTSGNITSYSWDFGDGGTSANANPNYVYLSASTYPVILTATASNGCKNSTKKQVQIFNEPLASFSLPSASPICTNQNFLFTNTSNADTGSNPTWQWSVNGVNAATTQDLNYVITTAASQSVTLSASIPGCSSQSTQSITTVLDGPLADFTLPVAACLNTPVSFVNTTSGSVKSYGWTFGDGNSSSQTNASNAYAATGNYSVTLTASNAAGCQNFLTKDISVFSNPQPDFVVEAPPYSCANYPAQFDNNTPALSDSNIATWSWSFGDAANGASSQKNPTYTFTSDAMYNVTLQAITNFGCTGSKQQSIVILPSPQAAFTNNPACINQPTQFTDASTGNIVSYKWTIQSATLTGAIPPPYVFKSAGTFPVTLTATGNNGCKNLGSKDIIIPVLPVMDFTFQSPCTGGSTIFEELNPGGPDPSVGWNWNFGSDSGVDSPVSYMFPSIGVYSVTLSATRQSGCVYSTSKNITIYDGPVARFTPSVQGGPAPLAVTFNNISTADSYFWQFGDAGNSTSYLFSPEFTYTQLGQFRALLSASNSHGCTDTLSTAIYVVIPRMDLAMKAFSLLEDPNSNSSKAVVTISNLGNIPLVNPEVEIDLGGNALLKEKIASTVLPGKSIQQTLSLEIVPQNLAYICAEVTLSGDVDTYNDKQCVSLTNSDVTFFPYPNPAKAQINFDWISAENENVIVTIYKSNGQVAFEQDFQFIQSGINQLTINTSSLAGGLYLIQFAGAKTKKTFRVMVAD